MGKSSSKVTLVIWGLFAAAIAGIDAAPRPERTSQNIFPLSIIHINDLHARYEPTDVSGGSCKENCIGGYARTVYTVNRLLQEQKDQNPIYINAGDNYQGTLWYNVGRWNVTSEFLNMLPADVMTLGNHEFDHGIAGVVPFLETLNTNILVANIDASNEPTMIGKYQKSIIIERSNRKIGVIGVILETTDNLANTGHLIFRNESLAIKEEAEKLKAQGANIIIVVSHCGYDVDKVIAAQTGADIDVIVGSHSHTFLYSGNNPPGPLKPSGDYPTIVNHESGNRVLIVQASAYARYVGNLTVFFDDAGNVVDHQGAPIYMGSDVPEDLDVKEAMLPWKEVIDTMGSVLIGETRVNLLKSPCSRGECNLGNFFCDAMVHSFVGLTPYNELAWTNVSIGLINNGALRVPLYQGNITYSHLITMSPFENTLVAFNLRGDKLVEALEYSVSTMVEWEGELSSQYFLQVAGLKVVFDMRKSVNNRVADVKVRCATCTVPTYELLDKDKSYRIVAPNFLTQGGDGFHMIQEHATDLQYEMTDIDALLAYTEQFSPIYTGIEGRIKIIK